MDALCSLWQVIVLSTYLPSLFCAVWLQQTRIGLSLFDIQGLGYLKESVSWTYVYSGASTSSQISQWLQLIPTGYTLNLCYIGVGIFVTIQCTTYFLAGFSHMVFYYDAHL